MILKKIILCAIIAFLSFSCSEEQFMVGQEVLGEAIDFSSDEPVTVTLVNQLEEGFSITSWRMVGYEFKNLSIHPGDSKQFLLLNGMRSHSHVNVTVVFSSPKATYSVSDKVDFTRIGITKITLSGCEACGGFGLGWSW